MPAWWDDRGVFARQREGLVVCPSPDSGCNARVPVREDARMVEARPFGRDRLLYLLADAAAEHEGLPTEIWIAAVDGRNARRIENLEPGAYPLDLDWTAARP
jgi:hypothetical protein